jgi:hypothetical protein
MKVYLHIGWHKTGSTSIQRFLAANREPLRAAGVDYPEAGMIATAHHLAAWSLQEPLRSAWARRIGFQGRAEPLFAEILEQSARRGARALILSSEEFSLQHAYRLERLARVLEGSDVTVIAYLRRQDRYLESLYGQMVKMAFVRLSSGFDDFVRARLQRGDLDYHALFTRWAEVFGSQRLVLRVYDRERLHGRDARLDFMRALGLEGLAGLQVAPDDANESLGRDAVLFLRRVNAAALGGGEHLRVVGALRALQDEGGRSPAPLCDAIDRLRILAPLRESNRRFGEEFLGDATAFEPSIDELAAQAAPQPSYGRQEFVRTLAAVLPRVLEPAARDA